MVTGFSKETLTDPFAVPECKDNCTGRWHSIKTDFDNNNNNNNKWHIGFADKEFSEAHPEKWWMGPVFQDGITSFATSTRPSLHMFIVLVSTLSQTHNFVHLLHILFRNIFSLSGSFIQNINYISHITS